MIVLDLAPEEADALREAIAYYLLANPQEDRDDHEQRRHRSFLHRIEAAITIE